MKKVLYIILAAIILFLVFVYISLSSTDAITDTCDLKNYQNVDEIDFSQHDSVLLSASSLYDANFIKEIMQGEHYREAWEAEIKVPIVYLDTLKGGLKIIEEGGGRQTESLELEDTLGITYTLRSINKNPEKLIPDIAKMLGLENIIVDGISAQHPYAATVVARLADQIGVLHTHPKIVFVPKQERLGKFNDNYGNRLYLFEYETKSEVNWTPYNGVKEIVDTDNLQELKAENLTPIQIDKKLLVRSRLFDLVIGDWDRHAKQWGWVMQKVGDSLKAIPLPCDRDNAFFDVDGVIPTLVAHRAFHPGMQSFSKEIGHIPGLVMPFDQYFLQHTEEELFLEQADYIKARLSNETIEKAFLQWPSSIYKLDAEEIISKIKVRRDSLSGYAKEFYGVLREKGLLNKPLKGSEDVELSDGMLQCFEC